MGYFSTYARPEFRKPRSTLRQAQDTTLGYEIRRSPSSHIGVNPEGVTKQVAESGSRRRLPAGTRGGRRGD